MGKLYQDYLLEGCKCIEDLLATTFFGYRIETTRFLGFCVSFSRLRHSIDKPNN